MALALPSSSSSSSATASSEAVAVAVAVAAAAAAAAVRCSRNRISAAQLSGSAPWRDACALIPRLRELLAGKTPRLRAESGGGACSF